MARKKVLVKDIDSSPFDARIERQVLLTTDTESALRELTDLAISSRNYEEAQPRALTVKEAEQAFQRWLPVAPRETRRAAAEISLSQTREKALDYLRSAFFATHPECVPPRKQGRPAWYVSPSMQTRLARGEVISMLINLAGEKLRSELLEDSRDVA